MGISKGKFKANVAGGGVVSGKACVAGAAAATDTPVAGLAATADVFSVVSFNAGVPTDVTANVTVVKAGAIQLSSVETGHTLLVSFEQAL